MMKAILKERGYTDMINKWLLYALVASLVFGLAAGTVLQGDILPEEGSGTEETRQYARGYIRVSAATTGGWLPLPAKAPYTPSRG